MVININGKDYSDEEITKQREELIQKNPYFEENVRNLFKNENVQTISLKELLESNIPKPEWLIEKLILKGGVTIMAGDYGNYKSWLAMDMGLKVSNGQTFLGELSTKKSKVVYVDEENRDFILKERSRLLINEDKEIGDFYFSIGNDVTLDEPIGLNKLKYIIEKYKPDLVILDSLVRLMVGLENDVRGVKEIFKNLKKYTKQGISFLILHHVRKPYNLPKTQQTYFDRADIRGSSDLGAGVDVVLIVNRRDDTIILESVKDRISRECLKPLQLTVEATEDTFEFKLLGYLDKREITQRPNVILQRANLLRNWISNLDEIAKFNILTYDIKKQFGWNDPQTNQALKELQTNGEIEQIKRGIWRCIEIGS